MPTIQFQPCQSYESHVTAASNLLWKFGGSRLVAYFGIQRHGGIWCVSCHGPGRKQQNPWTFGNKRLSNVSRVQYGPSTRVLVDQYVDADLEQIKTGWLIQQVQRDRIVEVWKEQGMTTEDIGILSDADEVFSRDFLRALQICDVPRFRPGQDCSSPKVVGSTLVFEGSPNCITSNRRWFHPDAIIGECIHGIGNTTRNPPVPRSFMGVKGPFKGAASSWKSKDGSAAPLWNGVDYRSREGGGIVKGPVAAKHQLTAFHFHNFFVSQETFSWKYINRGQNVRNADKLALEMIDPDVMVMVNCATGQYRDALPGVKYTQYEQNVSSLYYDPSFVDFMPVAFQSLAYRNARHADLQEIIRMSDQARSGNVLKEHELPRWWREHKQNVTR